MLDEGTSGLRKQHLPSVPSTHQACGMMQVQTSVALGGKRWFACMEPHTDTHDHSFGPDMRGEGTLCCHCRCYGIGGASKSHEEGISLGVHDVPVPPLECCAEELAVLLQQVGVALAQLLKQTSGPLHVGEEQRDGSPREVMHTEPPCLRSVAAQGHLSHSYSLLVEVPFPRSRYRISALSEVYHRVSFCSCVLMSSAFCSAVFPLCTHFLVLNAHAFVTSGNAREPGCARSPC